MSILLKQNFIRSTSEYRCLLDLPKKALRYDFLVDST